MSKKKLLIFGSSGSIGQNALAVVRRRREKFEITGLCVNSATAVLARQIEEFRPRYVCVADESRADGLAGCLPKGTVLLKGPSGMDEFAAINSDISLMAIAGISALTPLYKNIAYAKRIALANKESIVAAGDLVFKKARRCGTQIIPVDSEINSLYQLLLGGEKDPARVFITASGGALFGYKKNALRHVTPGRVLKHPTWKMGRRITVDSATLVNKAFEIVETRSFFGIPYDKIDVVVHRESTVHAMLECKDGTLLACIYPPDMCLPIAHSLYYPERVPFLSDSGMKRKFSLSFEPLDIRKYPAMAAVLEAAARGAAALAAVNAADEVAVEGFLRGKIRFDQIAAAIETVLKKCKQSCVKDIDDVFHWDRWGRDQAKD